MFKALRQKFFPVLPAPSVPVSELQPEPAVAPTLSPPDAGATVLQREDELSGFFPPDSGELIQGFHISAADVVLDIGCGDGHYAAFCGTQGAEIILADIDATKLASAGDQVKKTAARSVRTLVTDANPLPIETGTVSRIIATEVLEHVDDPLQFMSELVRVGQSGARYLISVPDPVLEHLQKDMAAPSYFEKPNHVRIFEREQFRELIRTAGLVIEKETSYGFYWSVWWIFFWVCKQDLSPPWHPLLESWTKTWGIFLATEQGPQFKKILDEFMPKSQVIIARKP